MAKQKKIQKKIYQQLQTNATKYTKNADMNQQMNQ